MGIVSRTSLRSDRQSFFLVLALAVFAVVLVLFFYPLQHTILLTSFALVVGILILVPSFARLVFPLLQGIVFGMVLVFCMFRSLLVMFEKLALVLLGLSSVLLSGTVHSVFIMRM